MVLKTFEEIDPMHILRMIELNNIGREPNPADEKAKKNLYVFARNMPSHFLDNPNEDFEAELNDETRAEYEAMGQTYYTDGEKIYHVFNFETLVRAFGTENIKFSTQINNSAQPPVKPEDRDSLKGVYVPDKFATIMRINDMDYLCLSPEHEIQVIKAYIEQYRQEKGITQLSSETYPSLGEAAGNDDDHFVFCQLAHSCPSHESWQELENENSGDLRSRVLDRIIIQEARSGNNITLPELIKEYSPKTL